MAKCTICQTELVWREPKGHQTWKAFWGCPNYKSHPAKTSPEPQNAPTTHPNTANGFQILADEIIDHKKNFNERMDGLSQAFVTISKKLIDLEKLIRENIGE